MTLERQCPRCGASYDVRWRGCDCCGWRAVPPRILAAAVAEISPAVEAQIRAEIRKATGLPDNAYRIVEDRPAGPDQVRVTVHLGRGRVT